MFAQPLIQDETHGRQKQLSRFGALASGLYGSSGWDKRQRRCDDARCMRSAERRLELHFYLRDEIETDCCLHHDGS